MPRIAVHAIENAPKQSRETLQVLAARTGKALNIHGLDIPSAPTDHVVTGPAKSAEIVVVPDCPNEQPAMDLFRRVLDDTGHPDEIGVSVIRTEEEAALCGFRGSPSFLIDGVDLFLGSCPDVAIACRAYAMRNGLRGLPSRDDLINAVTRLEPRGQT